MKDKDSAIIFTYFDYCIDYIYPNLDIYQKNDKITTFMLKLLNSKKKSRKKYIYLFTYNLGKLLNNLNELKALEEKEESIIQYEKFDYNGIKYVIKIYKKGEKRNRMLIIKDLTLFGQAATNAAMRKLKTNPESFLKLLEVIKDEFKININTKYKLSIPSIAKTIFKLKFPKQEKSIYNLNSDEYTFIRLGFIGGRNEIYKPIVEHTNYYYDVNSLYPFIMKTKPMPINAPIFRNLEYFSSQEQEGSEGFKLENFFGFLDVKVQAPEEIDCSFLPILAFRADMALITPPDYYDMKYEKILAGLPGMERLSTIYPLGIFKGVYFSEELKYALSHGYKIIKIYAGIQFPQSAVIFDGFVDLIYQKRLNALKDKKDFEEEFWKKMLNTLYGRYAMITTEIRDHFQDQNEKEEKEELEQENSNLKDDSKFITVTQKTKYHNVAISAAITAYARIYMHKIIFTNKLKILYWDTDGIFLSEPLPEQFITKTRELGKFRLESVNSCAVFISGKFYYYKPLSSAYVYKLRGIEKPFTIEEEGHSIILNKFKKIISHSTNSFSFQINISVKNNQGLYQDFVFVFYNKRENIFSDDNPENVLYTLPYKIIMDDEHKSIIFDKDGNVIIDISKLSTPNT